MLRSAMCLPEVHLQSLSELERFRLQEIALSCLRERGLSAAPKPGWQNARKMEKRRQDRRDSPHGVFGASLSYVIAQDRVERHRTSLGRSRRAFAEVESSVLSFRAQSRHALASEFSGSATFRNSFPQTRRRGALSVDSITELDDGEDRLLEALQLSHSEELSFQQKDSGTLPLSLNPIYRQVPRIVERCCSYIEKYGLQTVGIFRIAGSKKRVEQLREEFANSGDVLLGEDTCVHDISAVLKGFLRDLREPILPQELYTAFIKAAGLHSEERLKTLQLLIFALPSCNADTLLRVLKLLHKVSLHEKDTVSLSGDQIPGNKMSAANLATVFGPNLLQNEKGLADEKQSFLDSAAQITVTGSMIQHYQTLYTVPPHMHSELMTQLLQTDPEVVDYLLRRKSSNSQVLEEEEEGERKHDSQQSRVHFSSTMVPHTPLETLMKIQNTKERTGFLENPMLLTKRRMSRSQEDLTMFPTIAHHRGALPRILPLFFHDSPFHST
ncbi:PREDICTED: rho GTPase-activating protein 6-like [Nanorana parkeri]|uniref:rho GTPase-activating protein 6-like n=1 Tax=Nanorana parkeri TaxID=125878 RepID=UPI00085401BD|nr:PREDICTED: rho GTPase-activating protein 6-like [Nanorana parkeri]